MTPIYPPMRRKDRLLDEATTRRILEAGEYGVLATASVQTGALATPLSYSVEGDALYFHGARTGHKLENSKGEPHACFCVVGKTQPAFADGDFTSFFESALAFGPVRLVEDEAEKRRALEAICRKYLPEYEAEIESALKRSYSVTQVLCLDIMHVTGKAKRAAPGPE